MLAASRSATVEKVASEVQNNPSEWTSVTVTSAQIDG